jgi:acylphosphatase
MRRVEALVYGRVQGVYFRQSTLQKATGLGLNGWVANLPNGAVKVVAEGPERALQSLVAWLDQGSPASHVDFVDTHWADATGEFDGFDVRGW